MTGMLGGRRRGGGSSAHRAAQHICCPPLPTLAASGQDPATGNAWKWAREWTEYRPRVCVCALYVHMKNVCVCMQTYFYRHLCLCKICYNIYKNVLRCIIIHSMHATQCIHTPVLRQEEWYKPGTYPTTSSQISTNFEPIPNPNRRNEPLECHHSTPPLPLSPTMPRWGKEQTQTHT